VDRDQGAGGHRLQGAVLAQEDRLHVGIPGNAHGEHLGVLAHLAAAGGRRRATGRELLHLRGIEIVDQGLEPLGREGAGYGPAHVSEADVADADRHV
jgi:hypothetical protein